MGTGVWIPRYRQDKPEPSPSKTKATTEQPDTDSQARSTTGKAHRSQAQNCHQPSRTQQASASRTHTGSQDISRHPWGSSGSAAAADTRCGIAAPSSSSTSTSSLESSSQRRPLLRASSMPVPFSQPPPPPPPPPAPAHDESQSPTTVSALASSCAERLASSSSFTSNSTAASTARLAVARRVQSMTLPVAPGSAIGSWRSSSSWASGDHHSPGLLGNLQQHFGSASQGQQQQPSAQPTLQLSAAAEGAARASSWSDVPLIHTITPDSRTISDSWTLSNVVADCGAAVQGRLGPTTPGVAAAAAAGAGAAATAALAIPISAAAAAAAGSLGSSPSGGDVRFWSQQLPFPPAELHSGPPSDNGDLVAIASAADMAGVLCPPEPIITEVWGSSGADIGSHLLPGGQLTSALARSSSVTIPSLHQQQEQQQLLLLPDSISLGVSQQAVGVARNSSDSLLSSSLPAASAGYTHQCTSALAAPIISQQAAGSGVAALAAAMAHGKLAQLQELEAMHQKLCSEFAQLLPFV